MANVSNICPTRPEDVRGPLRLGSTRCCTASCITKCRWPIQMYVVAGILATIRAQPISVSTVEIKADPAATDHKPTQIMGRRTLGRRTSQRSWGRTLGRLRIPGDGRATNRSVVARVDLILWDRQVHGTRAGRASGRACHCPLALARTSPAACCSLCAPQDAQALPPFAGTNQPRPRRARGDGHFPPAHLVLKYSGRPMLDQNRDERMHTTPT